MLKLDKTIKADGSWHCRIDGRRVSRAVFEEVDAYAARERSTVTYRLGRWLEGLGAKLRAGAERRIARHYLAVGLGNAIADAPRGGLAYIDGGKYVVDVVDVDMAEER